MVYIKALNTVHFHNTHTHRHCVVCVGYARVSLFTVVHGSFTLTVARALEVSDCMLDIAIHR